jgi:RHS repeat-associated protein
VTDFGTVLSGARTLVSGAVQRQFQRLIDGPSEAEGAWAWPDIVVQSLLAVAHVPGEVVDALVAGATSLVLPPGHGLPPASLCTLHIGLPHSHPTNLTGVPLPGIGPPQLVGALQVLLGGLPALRLGDVGFAPTCLGSPTFQILTGSSNVFIGGKRAARIGDFTKHCPPPGIPEVASVVGEAFDAAMHGLSVAAIATGAVAHGAALASAIEDDSAGSEEVHELAVAGAALALAGTLAQGAADLALGPLHQSIGLIPSASPGDGMLLGPPPIRPVLVGGLPMPDLASAANAAVGRLLRRGMHWGARRAGMSGEDACALFGDPVDAVDGAVIDEHVDVDLGEGLRFTRRYSTRERARLGDCGYGVRHLYERELSVWLHRVELVSEKGERVRFPAFRGRDRVAHHGYAARRLGDHRYEITHRGESMLFVATPGVRAARLVRLHTEEAEHELAHDAQGRLRTIRVGARALVLVRDADGRIVRVDDERGVDRALFAYDRGALVAARDATGAESRFAYDDAHRLVSRRDARGYRFSWRYDEHGRCVHSSGEDGQWTVDFAYGDKKTTVTHGIGLVETVHYDHAGIVFRIERSDGSRLIRELDRSGRIVRERDAVGRVVEWLYDADGALVGCRDRFGHVVPPGTAPHAPHPRLRALPETYAERLGAPRSPRDAAPLDASARPAALESLAAWALPEASSARAPRVEHDAVGRIVAEIDARGRATSYRRDAAGNVVERTDRDHRTTRFDVTSWNLATTEVDALGRRTHRAFTATEEVARYVDARGGDTDYGRDVAGRLVSITRRGVLRETYVRDAGGRLVEKRDAHGAPLLRIAHHANGLPRRTELAEGGTITLDYDAQGRVTRARLGDCDAHLERDHARVVRKDTREGEGVERVQIGAREILTHFARFAVEIARHADGVAVVRDPTGGLTTLDARTPGRFVRVLANGTRDELALDPEGRIEGRLSHRTTSDGALASWAVRYERSAEGDLLSVWDTARGERRFEVDAAHRLLAERDEEGTRRDYRLDLDDELIGRAELGAVERDAQGLPSRTAHERFTHDARGRLASRTDAAGRTTRYGYDSLDQLVSAELPSGARWRGRYDGLGRLCRFGLEGRQTELFWDGDRIAAERAPDGAIRIHLYSDARALVPFGFVDYASLDAAPESGRAYFVFHDASGMPTQIEDATGRLVWWATRVDPWGALTLHPSTEVDYALRWPGHYADPDLALHHNRFRAYDPTLARYLQPDPVGHAQSLYAYAPNPLVDVDVLGLTCAPSQPHEAEEDGEGHPVAEAPAPRQATRLARRAALREELGLDSDGLLPSQRETYEQMRAADVWAARRYRYEQAQANYGDPVQPYARWRARAEQNIENQRRGSARERAAREGLARHRGRPLLDGNASETLLQENGTRPDSYAMADGEIDLVHDHKHLGGREQVVYDTEQFAAQREVAGDGEHVVTISSDHPNLNGVPPEPRPSRPLAEASTVYYADSEGNILFVWSNGRWE